MLRQEKKHQQRTIGNLGSLEEQKEKTAMKRPRTYDIVGEAKKHASMTNAMRGSLAVAAMIAATLTQVLSPTGASAQVKHTVIAATGTAAPQGGNFFRFQSIGMNARGQVAFDAQIHGAASTLGIFVGDGKTTSAIALAGNPDPASGDFGSVGSPTIAAGGEVVFAADTGIFRGKGETISPMVQDGDPAPGGGSLIGLGTYSSTSRGVIAVTTGVTDDVSTEGIFRSDGTRTVTIARDNTISPIGGTFLFFGDPVINSRGQVAYFAGMTGGPGDFGIFRGGDDGGENTTIFAANQSAPGGATFDDFGDPVINARGQVVATASLKDGISQVGLFRGDGRNAAAIALEGNPAPQGGNYTTRFSKPVVMNDPGQVAFNVGLTGGASRGGIFRGDGVTTSTVALEGTAAPGTTGTFSSFGDMKIGANGTVAFIGTLAVGVGGVDVTNNMGIWVGTSDSDLHLLVRTSDVIDGSTLIRLPRVQGLFDMNEQGVVWEGGFPGGTPGSCCCGGTCSSAIVFSRNFHAEKED
jgi:hypothetical protein